MKRLNSYFEATRWLFEQFPSYQEIGAKAFKPTLDNTRKIAKLLGNPQNSLKIIHVAGSNGKGSTCSMLASTLTEAGYTVGLFTSPHIKDYRERIRINGECIAEENVIDYVNQMRTESLDFAPSFFEMTLGLALKCFADNNCDICILETGLGGRLDATNIVTPIVSVITNISLEHTQMLGDTIELIAEEKAGIIKTNVPVVLGEMVSNAKKVMQEKATELNSPIQLEVDHDISTFDLPLLGDYQQENLQTVLNTISTLRKVGYTISEKQIQTGLDRLTINTGFVGRLQKMESSPTVLYDVSHNADGIKASLESVEKINKGKLHIIYGTSNDKDTNAIAAILPKNAQYYFTEFSNERSMQLATLKHIFSSELSDSVNYFKNPEEALNSAKQGSNQEDTILVIGSFFLIADFF